MSDILSLTAEQRLDMQLKGLNPRSPEEIDIYLNKKGRVQLNKQEAIEKVKQQLGEHVLQNSIPVVKGAGNWLGSSNSNAEVDIKKQLKEDMSGYANGNSDFVANKLSFDLPQRQNQPQSQLNLKQVQLNGYNLSIAYLNAFWRNIKSPSSTSRGEIYKTLQQVLKQEQTYKTNANALKAYQSGCNKAEMEFYQKISNR